MEALGRLINVLPVADDVYIDVRNCGGITFVCTNTAGDTWTLTEATAQAGTGAQVLSTIDKYYTSATVGAAWVERTQAVGSAFTTTSAQDVAILELDAIELSDGYGWVKLTSTSTGTVVAIQRDLHVQRKPANLPAMV